VPPEKEPQFGTTLQPLAQIALQLAQPELPAGQVLFAWKLHDEQRQSQLHCLGPVVPPPDPAEPLLAHWLLHGPSAVHCRNAVSGETPPGNCCEHDCTHALVALHAWMHERRLVH